MRITILPLLAAAFLVLSAEPLLFSADETPLTLPAPAVTAAQPPAADAAGDGINISLEELKTLLDRKETPRVAVTNVYHGAVTGRAVALDSKSGQLDIDVSAEGVGVGGILGIKTASIVSIKVLVPLTQDQVDAAGAASAAYLSKVRSQAASAASSEALSAAGEAEGLEDVAATAETVSATDSALALPDLEPEILMLEKYPPKEGWGPKRLAEIVQKAVVLHLEPFGKEKTFLKEYDAWKEEYNKERTSQLEALEAFKGMNEPVPDDFEVWPELQPVPALAGASSPASDSPVGDSSDEEPVGMPSAPSGASSGR